MIVAIVGATGTGKTAASLDLADRLGRFGAAAEIVNADAMQLYRGMDIGTAKATVAERRGVPHHLIDVLDVTDEASVAAYQRDARASVEQIAARGAIPIVVGGSGLYVAALLTTSAFPAPTPKCERATKRGSSPRGSVRSRPSFSVVIRRPQPSSTCRTPAASCAPSRLRDHG